MDTVDYGLTKKARTMLDNEVYHLKSKAKGLREDVRKLTAIAEELESTADHLERLYTEWDVVEAIKS